MEKIKIITDSTAALPDHIIEEYDIEVVPLLVSWEGESYRDGIDLKAEEFYGLLPKKKELPKTSQPQVGTFVEVYKKYIDEGYKIMSIHISSGLSGTVQSAETARGMVDPEKIMVFDSLYTSGGLALQVLEAAWAVKKGKVIGEIEERLNQVREKISLFLQLDTLEYLYKGGRIGRVTAALGSIMNVKPIIEMQNGINVPLARVRSQRQGIKFMIEEMKKRLGDNKVIHAAVGHGNAKEAAEALKSEIRKHFQCLEMVDFKAGVVISSHTGPGIFAVMFYPVES